MIDSRHAGLASKRRGCEQTLTALHTWAAQPEPRLSVRPPQSLWVGEAARYVDVRVSALHFWEQQGLLHPLRDRSGHYRLYRSVLDEMAAGRPKKTMVAGEKRREELTWTSWRCIEALACFQRSVHEFCGELLARASLGDGIQWGDFPEHIHAPLLFEKLFLLVSERRRDSFLLAHHAIIVQL